jgi:polyphosphate kinase 2 (PPK2 family)
MLNTVDLDKSLSKSEYREQLMKNQVELRHLAHELYKVRRPLIVVYEGWDASGKGGSIRRVTEKLDPRGYQVYSIAAPEGDDRTHHYLWRFWRRLLPPDEKQVLIFDRSWYGRVLVERVEGFASEREWKRAYFEINDFERQLIDSGMLIIKFWFHISQDEQLRRFEARSNTPYKAWKLTEEDWRNRERWEPYEEAVSEMLVRTSTGKAPWFVVEGNDKYYARVKVLSHLTKLLDQELTKQNDKKNRKRSKKQKNSE